MKGRSARKVTLNAPSRQSIKSLSPFNASRSSLAIAESRQAAWDTITSRRHEILRVFAGKSNYSELILIKKLIAGLKNRNEVVIEFIAQIELEGDTSKDPKGTLYKVWRVSGFDNQNGWLEG
jgi:hypothetical protein